MAELILVVDARLAGAIIGKAGATLRRISESSGVDKIQLSQPQVGAPSRRVTISGGGESVKEAYAQVVGVLRGSSAGGTTTRIEVPHAAAGMLIGNGGSAVRKVRQESGASVDVAPASDGVGARLLTCTGDASRVDAAVRLIIDAIAQRERNRHADFLSAWPFETSYNDHFETPTAAYTHVMPILQRLNARRQRARASTNSSKKRPREMDEEEQQLRVYDPYYCEGAVVEALVKLGCAREQIIHANRDFYADVTADCVPPHDLLLTNPPYSGAHKQRLLEYLLARNGVGSGASTPPRSGGGAPFLLLMPAWVAATDYWHAFLLALARSRTGETARAVAIDHGREEQLTPPPRELERVAGVFYLSPTERYSFTHPQATGSADAPFHSIWFAGGFGPDEKAAIAALKPLRHMRPRAAVEVFRSAAMLQRRGHFTPAAAAKRSGSK